MYLALDKETIQEHTRKAGFRIVFPWYAGYCPLRFLIEALARVSNAYLN